ncbi:hypothetical protein C4D60_Mb07t20520 [Musa balbisiana]|uniref:Uncharacterized protein n=1 Tax=Musa balbisiana TaxID=52838 RepID=A0A4S8JHF4_MUSBA|nr:hypothetical protein C4D60_Mb07t20520 [Musa balbisiana]
MSGRLDSEARVVVLADGKQLLALCVTYKIWAERTWGLDHVRVGVHKWVGTGVVTLSKRRKQDPIAGDSATSDAGKAESMVKDEWNAHRYLRTMRCPNGERSAISLDRTGLLSGARQTLLGGDPTAPPNILIIP